MRLTCPNCGAQYEVPDEVIPHEGRDVQCSNCGNTWYQEHPDYPLQDTDTAEDAEEAWAEPETAEPVRRALDSSVTDVLREEAEREARLREQDAPSGLESQPDLGLDEGDDSARRAEEARTRMSRMRGEDPAPPPSQDSAAEVESRRGLLPDIEDINSTLKSGSTALAKPNLDPDVEEAAPRKSGFSRGFALAVLLIVILVLIYTQAPRISQAVPALDGALNAYVTFVDNLRLSLDALMVKITPDS